MTLRYRLMLGMTLIVGLTAVLGVASVLGLQGLSARYAAAEEQYSQLRSLYEIGHRTATVRLLLHGEHPDRELILRHLESAGAESAKLGEGGHVLDLEIAGAIKALMESPAIHAPDKQLPKELDADVNRWLARIAALAGEREKEVLDNRRIATAGLQRLEVELSGLLLATIASASIIGVLLYRAIMRPLETLNKAIDQIAGSHYQHRIKERGDREFRRVMRHFNAMSAAVQGLHSSMARQVEIKSRQLVRSEQLAGVGFLAAGLAHEINNPLAIIAGYAQVGMRRIDEAKDEAGREEALRRARSTLVVVCEETFRCRDIAMQLMDLARPADSEPGLFMVRAVVERAIGLIGGLPLAAGRELVVRSDADSEGMACRGHAPHVLQVLINLLTNALESCPAETGRVIVSLAREGGSALVAVSDNGRGMDGQTLEHAFEPFFTDKPRRGRTGCGLGLSVSHAIVQRLSGRLYAHSDGPGRGSTFTIELPIASDAGVEREEVAVA